MVLDGDGEAYLDVTEDWSSLRDDRVLADSMLGVRAAVGGEVRGTVYLPNSENDGYDTYRFTLPGTREPDATAQRYFEIKAAYFSRLAAAGLPGGAWFRHQAEAAWESAVALIEDEEARGELQERRQRFRERLSEVSRTYEMFTGGRAIAENLRLDRELDASDDADRVVALDSLPELDVQEIDWTERNAGLAPSLDPLAALIPIDQHAAFFPSLAALDRVLDEAESYGTPVLQMLEPRAESAGSRARYQRQLCVELGELEKMLGDAAIESVAITGSDPYFRTGSDVALLFECKNADAVVGYLASRLAGVAYTTGIEPVQGEFDGLLYQGLASADRSVSSYMIWHDGVVMLTNSLYQAERFASLATGNGAALAAAPEYLYFRDRYPRGAATESAFVILSDATIRRWGSARWRIGASRRTLAAAELAEQRAAAIAAGEVGPAPRSEEFNTLDFLRPIAELPLDMVTQAEADAYTRFRNRYQGEWREFFDPIAASLELSPQRVGLDLSVIPLIGATDYREFLDLTQGARLAGDEADPHAGTLFHGVMALDTQSSTFRMFGSLAYAIGAGGGAEPLAWVGNAVALYADQDEFWDQLSAAEDPEDFLEYNFFRLPIALHVEVDSALSLTAFLTALRAFSNQAAPDMTLWETRTHQERSYVRIAASPEFAAEEPDDSVLQQLALYYVALPGSFVVSLREDMIQRAIERHRARRDTESPTAPQAPWLGESLALRVDGSILRHPLLWQEVHPEFAAWRNLPILNTWRSLYPDRDPVAVHTELWGTALLCPGGGSYVWNETDKTMESTVYGHPAAPRLGPKIPAPLLGLQMADFGLSFENEGLRAQVQLERAAGR